MSVIDKISRKGVGEFIIKFSKRMKRFEITLPTGVNNGIIKTEWLYFTDYQFLESRLDKIQSVVLSEEKATQKFICIKFETSESTHIHKHESAGLSKGQSWNRDTNEKLYNGIGFTIQWWVVQEFDIAGHLNYMIIEKSKNAGRNVMTKPNIYGQIFSNDPIRQLKYSDELYSFLLSLEAKVATLCNQLISFFDPDETKFIENIQQNANRLLNQ